MWSEIKKRFRVLRVKNTFASCDPLETYGMQQILVNVLLEPKRPGTDEALTYGDMVASKGFRRAVESAAQANPGAMYSAYVRQSAALFRGQPGLRFADEPIRMVVELQLHLEYYLAQRKKTHLWFKILRAEALRFLNLDCCAYRDGPKEACAEHITTTGSTSSDSGDGDSDWTENGGSPGSWQASDSDEEDLWSVAACDRCQRPLYLPEVRDCPGKHGLALRTVQSHVEAEGREPIDEGEGPAEDTECLSCEEAILPGGEAFGCLECGLDLCLPCAGAWYHERNGDEDLCSVHYAAAAQALGADAVSAKYVEVERKEDLGGQQVDYFGSDDDGDGGDDDDDGADASDDSADAGSDSADADCGRAAL